MISNECVQLPGRFAINTKIRGMHNQRDENDGASCQDYLLIPIHDSNVSPRTMVHLTPQFSNGASAPPAATN
jgi:hypothetical protein